MEDLVQVHPNQPMGLLIMNGRIIWVKPEKGTNLSIGRKKIVEKLTKRYDIEFRRGMNLSVLKELLFGDYEILIGTTRIGALSGLISKMRGKRVIIDHVDPIKQFKLTDGFFLGIFVEVLENFAFRFSDAVLITNDEDVGRVKKRAKKVIKSRLGVDFKKFSSPSEKSVEDARRVFEKNRVSISNPVVTYVGGFERIYNLDKLILAMKHLGDWNLVLIGEGTMENSLRDLIKRETIKNVYFFGTVDNDTIPGILSLTNVCVTLCDTPRQVKILEYAASGKPIVALESVKKSFSKVMVTTLDPKDIARAINSASKLPEQDLREFQEGMLEYDYGKIALLYGEIIEEVISK